MKNLKLTTKIVAAFSLVVILFIATLIIFFNSLNNSNKGLSEYQSFSNNVITINSIKEDFYESYLIATDYFEVPDQNKANNFNDILENSVKTIKDNNINIDDVKNELISYKTNFNNIVELQNKKQNYIDVDFKNLINQFDKKINEFKKAAEDKNDYSLGYYADSTIEIVPELIKYTNTYFQKSNSNNLELAKNEIQKLESQILMIKMGVSKELKQYYDDLNTIYENINNKFTDIINISNEQTPIIEQIQSQKNKLVSLINDKQNYFTNQQSSLENNLVSKNKNSLFITLLISGISIIIIIIASFYISLTIKKKISEMNKKINSFKNGDLNTNFKNNSNDEFGFMSSNLQNMADTLKNSFLNIFDISSNIDKTANELTNISVINNSISNEINSKTTMISSNSDEVKEEFIKITNSIEEISNASYNISDIANDLNQKAINATNSAKDGVNSISNITKKINTAVKTSLETEGNINELVQHSEKVKEILNTIDNITEQTSLLALNAAIEAARAGEAGKGFAVVADEIRKLAEGSKKSTEQISNILIKISNSTKSVSTASESNVNSVKDIEKEIKSIKIQFKGIMNDIELMNSEIENMASSSEEQSANLESINESMKTVQSSVSNISDQIKEIDTSIDKMADGAHKTSNNADLLSKYSENLINYIKYFKFQ